MDWLPEGVAQMGKRKWETGGKLSILTTGGVHTRRHWLIPCKMKWTWTKSWLAFSVWTLSSSSLGTVSFRCLLHYHWGESSVYILLVQRMKIQIPWQKHQRVAAIILKSQGQRLEMVTWILQLSFYKRDSLNLDFPSLGKAHKIQYWFLPQVSWSLTKDMKIIFRRSGVIQMIYLDLKILFDRKCNRLRRVPLLFSAFLGQVSGPCCMKWAT